MAKPHPAHDPGDTEATSFAAAVQEGIDDADAGRAIPYDDVRRWLLSWGTENELPPPECE